MFRDSSNRDEEFLETETFTEIRDFVFRAASVFEPTEMMISVISADGVFDISRLFNRFEGPHATGVKPKTYWQIKPAFDSGNLLGEDIVASSVYFSGVSSGNTGTKPTGLS